MPVYIVNKLERVLGLSLVMQEVYLQLLFRARLWSAAYSRRCPRGSIDVWGGFQLVFITGSTVCPCSPGHLSFWTHSCKAYFSVRDLTLRIFHCQYLTSNFLCWRVSLISVMLCAIWEEMGPSHMLVPPGTAILLKWHHSRVWRGKKTTAFLSCHEVRETPFILCLLYGRKNLSLCRMLAANSFKNWINGSALLSF